MTVPLLLPVWRVHRRRMVALALAALAFLAGPAALAQSLSLTSGPAAIGRLVLGDLTQGQAAVGVWRDGKASAALVQAGTATLATMAADGPLPDPASETLFEIGSISKVFTGLLLAQAVERGDLKLDDRLGDLLGKDVPFASPAVAGVTLRQLVTHSSCLPRLPADFWEGAKQSSPYASYDRARLWRALAAQTMTASPPCDPEYSNYAFAVLGELLAQRAGLSWYELVSARITGPLGMRHTLQLLGDQVGRLAPPFVGRAAASTWEMQAFAGAGGLRSTVGDMLIFSRAVMASEKGPLGPAAVRFMTPLGKIDMGEIGYGVWISGPPEQRSVFHEGWTGGYRALWLVRPAVQEALVVLASNGQSAPYRARIALAALWHPVTARPAPATAPLPDYAGVYSSPLFASITFVAQDGVLYRRPSRASFRPLEPVGTDTFVDRAAGVTHQFSREGGKPDGRVTSLLFTQGGGAVRLERTALAAPAVAVMSPAQAQAYAGAYLNRKLVGANLAFDVQVADGQLLVQVNNQPRVTVYPVPGQPDRFSYEVVKAELQFERDAAGQVTGLVLHQNGEHRAPRVGAP